MGGWVLRQRYGFSGGTVRYDTFGAGPPLVLVHGTPSSSYLWRNVIPELAKQWTVYVHDLLGYGASEKHDGQDVSIAAQTRLMAELLRHWRLDEPAVAGHDFGGAITLRTHLLEGWPFRAIALLDPVAISPWGSPFAQLVKKHVEVFQQIPADIYRQMVAAYIRGAIHRKMDDEAIAPYVEPWLGPERQDAFFRQIAQFDERFTDEVEPHYGRIQRPVLILWGEKDRWIPPAMGARLQEVIPHSELRVIADAGHFVQEDAPEIVAAHLLEFFSRHAASR
jgi:pimeloyl-ACP methyl ester carboxylesterase